MRANKLKTSVSIGSFLLLGVAASSGQDSRSAICHTGVDRGFVEAVNGNWIDAKYLRPASGKLDVFSKVCDDSELVPPGPASASNSISIRFVDGTSTTYKCGVPSSCQKAITFDKTKTTPSGFLQVVMAFLQGQEPPVAKVVSRGGALDDAILDLRSGQLNIGPAVRYTDPGRYDVSLCRIDLDHTANCGETLFKQQLEVDGTDTKPISAASLKPGLYQLEIRDVSSANAIAADSWVLIANGENFDRLNSKYQSDLGAASGWKNSAPEFSRLVRLYFVGLARTM